MALNCNDKWGFIIREQKAREMWREGGRREETRARQIFKAQAFADID